jgi:thioester reductase-like protein
MGYSESKWVAEQILENFSKTTQLKSIIVRIGQLAGAAGNGAWNTKEWFPTLVKSGGALGCLPDGTNVSIAEVAAGGVIKAPTDYNLDPH